jgi:hypothetical protein
MFPTNTYQKIDISFKYYVTMTVLRFKGGDKMEILYKLRGRLQ